VKLFAAGRTDPGRVRSSNEDAYFIGDSIFAVADGMGGHVAGEVASATALGPLEEIDARVYPDGATAIHALEGAIKDANKQVIAKAMDSPEYEGMGTTLTALMFEGRRIHFAHVGDSRAYLLRDGQFSQLTRDHTFVQQLVEEGRISEEEAAVHPRRSVITRAIGVPGEIDVDVMTLDLEQGDQLLLCSDGLTGVVDDEEIARILGELDPPDRTVERLVQSANRAGGPDNITTVLLRWDETPTGPLRNGTTGDLSGPAIRVKSGAEGGPGDGWVQGMRRFGTFTSRRRGTGLPQHRRSIAGILVALVLLGALLYGGGRWLLGRSWYVGVEGEQVTIFQGVDASIGPLDLHWVAETTDLELSEVAPFFAEQLRDTIPAASLADARRIVDNAHRVSPDPGPTPIDEETIPT
jgi:protein phosphatase